MSRIRQFAGQTLTYGVGHILSRILFYLLITVYLTYRIKDQYQYGVYTDIYAYVTVLIVLFSMRLDTAFFRFGNKSEQRNAAFGSAWVPMIISAIVIVIIGHTLDDFFAALLLYPDSPYYVRWFSIILAFDILSLLPFARLRLENKAKLFVLAKVFNVLFTIGLVLFFLEIVPRSSIQDLEWLPRYAFDIDYVFLSNLIASVAVFLLVLFFAKPGGIVFNSALMKKMLYYAFPLIIVGVCGSFNQFFAVPLQKYFLGKDVVENIAQGGVYGASQKIASIFLLFTTAFNYAAEPFFFNNSNEEDRTELYGKICRMFVLIGGILILTIYLGIDLFQFLVDGSLRDAIHVVPILLLAYLFLGIYYNVAIWYKLADKTIYGALVSFIGVVITFSISIVFLPKYGYIASAWAALITFGVMVVIVYILGKKHFPIPYPVTKILNSILILITVIIISFLTDRFLPKAYYYITNLLLFLGYLYYCYSAELVEWKAIIGNKSKGGP
ncbi:MAG: oligosaccharide flippase family protein [Saprospiraceae bacterium]|nr:oligosaccharide flippase family protein [Saprospiraceae bacterium]